MARPVFPEGTFDNSEWGPSLIQSEKIEESMESYWAASNPSKSREAVRMEKAALVQFVLDFCDEKVFTSAHLRDPERELPMVFLPAVMGAFEGWPEEGLKTIGILWAYYGEELPQGINGLPMFPTVRVMHVEDWQSAKKAIAKEKARRNGARQIIEEDL